MAHDERDAGDALADELEILRLVARLAQASDDRDEIAYRECFADSVGRALDTAVSAEAYARQAMARLSRTDWTHHKLANPVVRVDTRRARATARIDVVVEIASTRDGRQQHATVGGRYELSFVRENAGWRIDGRVLHQRYVLGVLDPELGSPA